MKSCLCSWSWKAGKTLWHTWSYKFIPDGKSTEFRRATLNFAQEENTTRCCWWFAWSCWWFAWSINALILFVLFNVVTYRLVPGKSIYFGGLARLDYVDGPGPLYLSLFFSKYLIYWHIDYDDGGDDNNLVIVNSTGSWRFIRHLSLKPMKCWRNILVISSSRL